MLKICGSNYFSQLGEKSLNNKFSHGSPIICPPANSNLEVESIISYSTNGDFTVIITKSGEIFAVGNNKNNEISGVLPKNVLNKLTKLEIRDKEGTLYHPISAVCGDNYTLYMVSTSIYGKSQLVVSYFDITADFPLFLNIDDFNPIALFGGCFNAAAIDEEGSIIFIYRQEYVSPDSQFKPYHLPGNEKAVSVACLDKKYYVLGLSGIVYFVKKKDDEYNFTEVQSLNKINIVEISGISDHCIALDENGNAYAIGENESGKLGINAKRSYRCTQFKLIHIKRKFKAVYAGVAHSLFQTERGEILACGDNIYGGLFLDNIKEEMYFSPVETEIKKGAIFCVAGNSKSAAFIGHDPIMSPNRRIHSFKQKAQEIKDTFSLPSESMKSDENFFVDEDEENQFHINAGKIGESDSSVVYKIIDKRTKTPLCKKVLKYRDDATMKDAKRAMNEFKVMYSVNHPCICKATGINIAEPIEITNSEGQQEKSTTIALFFEYLPYKLKEFLKIPIINNTLKVRIVLDIVHAMNYLHKHGMMHRNLTVENIMLNSLFETKLVDFYLVKIIETVFDDSYFSESSLTKCVGNFLYMSPEMANEEDYEYKTDVYSFGIILYFIFVGKLPNQSLNDKVEGKKISLPKPSFSISQFCIKLISKCLEFSPSDRPSFDEILQLMRKNSYELADDVDFSILSKKDKELELFENQK